MRRRQAKKILRRDAPDDNMRALLGKVYAVFDDVRPMRRGRSKAISIVSRDADRDPDRIYGRWSPETAEEKRRINRECAEAAERMMPRIHELLAKHAAAREAETRERK